MRDGEGGGGVGNWELRGEGRKEKKKGFGYRDFIREN